MRVTSDFWVSALVRRCNSSGAAAFVVKRGSPEAGAIFLTVDRLNGEIDLYGPAPQALFGPDATGERQFETLAERSDPVTVHERLEREKNFDPDVWIVAVEDREGRAFLGDAEPEN